MANKSEDCSHFDSALTRYAQCERDFASRLEHVARQVLALRELLEFGVNVCGIDGDRRSRVPGGIERYFLEQFLHHGVEAPRADVFSLFVDLPRDFGKPLDRTRLKIDRHALGLEQRGILARQAGVRVGEYLLEIADV